MVHVSLLVYGGLYYPCNVQSNLNCTDVVLNWEMCPLGAPDPDSYNVYRDDEIIANVTEKFCTDSLLFPNSIYEYKITALYGGDETFPSSVEEVTIPLPENLEPVNLQGIADIPQEFDVTLWWDEPDACLNPDGYNIYRFGSQINQELVTELTYVDQAITLSYIEYYVTAVYYFGESEPSETAYVIMPGLNDKLISLAFIFPNPAKDKLFIKSPEVIYSIELLNNMGLIILNNKVNSKSYQLNVSHLSAGIYFVKLETDEGLVIRKILIE
ncbi:MAG: T9SS type A sorting domain-containing protein [Bacteroidales bacterium]|nr:T9SS type A sorting domain-containing protein [Bacteroidales bacterium]